VSRSDSSAALPEQVLEEEAEKQARQRAGRKQRAASSKAGVPRKEIIE